MNLPAIQAALRERNIDAWLFYDHHHRDPIGTGCWDCLTADGYAPLVLHDPREGEPHKLVHKIEAGHLDSVPGEKQRVRRMARTLDNLKALLGASQVAMQYSPNNLILTLVGGCGYG